MAVGNDTRELAELKARLAVLEPPKPPKPPKPPGRKSKGGCGTYLLIGIGTFAGLGILGAIFHRDDPAGENLTAAPMSCDDAWATKVWSAAGRAGLVRGQELRGLDLIVLVSPFGWSQLSLDRQKDLGLAAACQLGKSFDAISVHFRYDVNGRDGLTLTHTDIYSLGRGRFVPTPSNPPPVGFRGLEWGTAPMAGLHALPGGMVWVTSANPHPAYLGVSPTDEDYEFVHRRLVGGDLFFKGPAAYAQLKIALQKAYGNPSTAYGTDDTDNYVWNWRSKKVSVGLTFEKTKADSTLHFQ